MQPCQVIKNSPIRDRICLAGDTISHESVGVGVRTFATVSQMSISSFSWYKIITHVMERS